MPMSMNVTTLGVGSTIHFRPDPLHGVATLVLADVECATVVSHGDGATSKGVSLPWCVLERPDGQRVNVLDVDIEDAILA